MIAAFGSIGALTVAAVPVARLSDSTPGRAALLPVGFATTQKILEVPLIAFLAFSRLEGLERL